ncbi:MAG: hypothetical protein ACLSH6_05965 [Limosilactobacillus pontis]
MPSVSALQTQFGICQDFKIPFSTVINSGLVLTSVLSGTGVANIVDYAFKAAINAGQAASQQQQYVILPEKDNDDYYQAQMIPKPTSRHLTPMKS